MYQSYSELNKTQFSQLISLKICLTQIYSTIILRTYNICHYSLRYQSFKQILDADILNYSPPVMFRGTHCTVYITIFYNSLTYPIHMYLLPRFINRIDLS